mmetsp:Transcript_13208/g.37176  ORF Transcript_13208/g.37176 Transcript_13208/m.37176 type:complete len:92 (-) Transcript_13208:668-943(-)
MAATRLDAYGSVVLHAHALQLVVAVQSVKTGAAHCVKAVAAPAPTSSTKASGAACSVKSSSVGLFLKKVPSAGRVLKVPAAGRILKALSAV